MAVDRAYINQLQADAERRWKLLSGLLDRTVEVESGYRPDVASGQKVSSAGAQGLYQLMPGTAKLLGGIDPYNVKQATEGAARLWREALDRYGGDVRLAAADYNAGAPVVADVLAGKRGFKPETIAYMDRFNDFIDGGQNMIIAPPVQAGIVADEIDPTMPMQPVMPQQMAMAPQPTMMGPPQPTPEPQRDWAGLGYGLAEILATANNEPRMAEVFRRRREARNAGMNQQQLSGMQREYLLAQQQGYQGSFLDFVRDRSLMAQARPGAAGGVAAKTHRIGNQLVRELPTGEVDVIYEGPTGGGRRGGTGRAMIRKIDGIDHWVDPYTREATPVATRQERAPQTTEGERAAAGFYNRMLQAENELLERETPETFDMIASQFGDIGNYLTSPEGQVTLQKQVDWARAKLRSESGAVIGVDEARDEAANLFPRPGDSPEVIQAKQRSRQAALEQMRLKSGRATYFIDQMEDQDTEDDFEPPEPQSVGAGQVVVPGSLESERSALMQEMDAWRQEQGL